jgi:hypothetical protein
MTAQEPLEPRGRRSGNMKVRYIKLERETGIEPATFSLGS